MSTPVENPRNVASWVAVFEEAPPSWSDLRMWRDLMLQARGDAAGPGLRWTAGDAEAVYRAALRAARGRSRWLHKRSLAPWAARVRATVARFTTWMDAK
jgi:hypothetical protein